MKYWFNLIIQSQGKRLYIGIFWAFMTALSGIALLMLSGWFITATALTGLAISAGLVVIFDMYMPGSGIRFFALSRTVGRYVERLYNHDSILRLISTYRLTLFKSLSNLSSQQLRATSDSEWLGRLTADLDALDTMLLSYLIPPIVATLSVVTLTFFLGFFWFDLAIYLGSILLLCLFASIRITVTRTKEYGSSTASLLNGSRSDVIEHLQGAYELQSNGLMQQHEQSILNRLNEFYRAQEKLNSNLANIQWVLDCILGLILMSLIVTGLMAINAELISGPVAIMIVMMFLGLSELLQAIPSQFSRWGATSFAANRLTQLVKTTPPAQTTMIKQIDSLAVSIHQHAKIALSQQQALSFSLVKHQLVNIQGRSGSGKSTVARLLTGAESFIRLDENNTEENNSIRINEKFQLSEVNLENWYSHIAYLEQRNTLLAGTLGYNLAIGLSDDDLNTSEHDVWKVLKMVELFDWANSLPEGLNTWLGEAGSKVSGGQARRICLARLLLRSPQLVILDEPFNGIDNVMAARIWNNIEPWLSARMTILLTHERPDYLPRICSVVEPSGKDSLPVQEICFDVKQH